MDDKAKRRNVKSATGTVHVCEGPVRYAKTMNYRTAICGACIDVCYSDSNTTAPVTCKRCLKQLDKEEKHA